MEKKIVCIFVDALRNDFITSEKMPFLSSLVEKYGLNEVETILGYSDAIESSIFTGTYPDKHGYWMKYWYDPENSPFKDDIFKILKVIDKIPNPKIRSGINYLLHYTLYEWYSKRKGYSELSTGNIPYNLIKKFDYTRKKSLIDKNVFEIKTLFDILRKNGMDFFYNRSIRKKNLQRFDNVNLGIIYLSDIDFSAHQYGIYDEKFIKYLRRTDEKIEKIYNFVSKNYSNVDICIFSDHGMAEVNDILNFDALFDEKGFEDRFLFVLDGTMLRFWYFDEEIKEYIRQSFSKRDYGHFLAEKEKKELRIDFNHKRYGDDIFLLNQGHAIYPNFLSWDKPEAMHAYHPRNEEQNGIFLINKEMNNKKKMMKIIDIMPTILDSLELEKPESIEGESHL